MRPRPPLAFAVLDFGLIGACLGLWCVIALA
jgi:hypothetical protein